MSTRAWIYVSLAYALLAIGMVVSLWYFSRTTDRLDKHQKEIKATLIVLRRRVVEVKQASIVFCEVSRRNDIGEATVLLELSNGRNVKVSPECVKLIHRIFK